MKKLLFIFLLLINTNIIQAQTVDKCFNLTIVSEKMKQTEGRACYAKVLSLQLDEYAQRPDKKLAKIIGINLANYGNTYEHENCWIAFNSYYKAYTYYQHPIIEEGLVNLIKYLANNPIEIPNIEEFNKKKSIVDGKNPELNQQVQKVIKDDTHEGNYYHHSNIDNVEVYIQGDTTTVEGVIIK